MKLDEIDQSSFTDVHLITMILMYIETGGKNKEPRLTEVSDLDIDEWIIYFRHVEGSRTAASPAPCRSQRRSAR